MKPNRNNETAKDFKSSIKRLMLELKNFYFLIVLALLLAALGSLIAIFTPNILSDLTDKISGGLVINTKNMETLSKEMSTSLNTKSLIEDIDDILSLDPYKNIINNNKLSETNRTNLTNIFKSKDYKLIMDELSKLDNKTLELIFTPTNFKEVEITVEDKINLIKSINNDIPVIPTKLLENYLTEVTIDNTKISTHDLALAINAFSKIDKEDGQNLYKQLDKMPPSIKQIIKPTMDKEGIKKITILLLVLYLISATFTYIESISMTDVSNKFAKKLRNNISHKINRLPLKHFDKNATGDILSRVTNDVDTIAQSMNNSLSTLVSAITLFLGTIIMMFITNWVMALTAIFASLLGFIFMFLVLKKSQKYFIARQQELGKLNSHIEEVYSGLNIVKAYNGKEQCDKKFDELNEKLYNANRKSQFLSGLMMPMMMFIGNFGYVAVCIVGALLTMNGHITFGVIIAFITYVRLFTSPLSQIGQAMTSLQSTAAAAERVFEFMDEPEMSNQKEITNNISRENVAGKIEFKDVTFTYDGNDLPTIKKFNATAKPGQKVAIVGPTGAGKTTMVNLLMKFYDISGGDILIDDISTKKLTRENIHDLFTMVLQDTWVFEGTIKDNIIYNRKNITDERVEEVCKTVGLHHFIKTLPDSYNTILTDNDTISAGQKQLLTIARAMLDNTPFLILDEATSNVDTRTEELVQNAMDKLTVGKTSFIIAHRLSTIKNADLILVMKEGNIIEQGNHEELMQQKGFYADLYNSQFEL